MNRIIEAFTRPHYQVTGIDEILRACVVILVIAVVFVIISLIGVYLNRK